MTLLSELEQASRVHKRATDLREFWRARDIQWQKDRSLLAMQYKRRTPPFELIISNEAPVLHAGAVSILTGKPPQFRLPITVQEQAERIRHDKSERFIQAIFQEVAKWWRQKGNGSWLADLAYYVCLGAVAGLPHIVKRPRKPPEFRCEIFDPMNVYPSYGDNGMLAVARIYTTTWEDAATIAANLGGKLQATEKKKEVEVINFWEMGLEEEGDDPDIPYNIVLMDGKVVKPRTAHEEFGRIPIFMKPINGVPYRDYGNPMYAVESTQLSQSIVDWTAHWGRAIFWANRDLYPALDRQLSYEAERSRRAAYGKYLALTADGQVIFSEEDFEKASVVTMDATQGESLAPLQTPQMPREGLELITQIFSMTQRGGLNRLALGDLNLEISGVTLERAIAAARYVLQPYADGLQAALADIAMTFFDQARRMNLRSVELEVRRDELGADMAYLVEEFSREDIPKTTHVEVRLPMLLPDDRMQKATVARMLIPGNEPLMDRQTVAEDVLDVQDWTTMQRRISEDVAETDPVIRQVKLMAAIRRKIDDWAQTPGMESAVAEATLALQTMRDQFSQTFAPREQPATQLQARGAEPRPEAQNAEGGPFRPTEAEVVFNQPSATPQRPNVRRILQGLAQGTNGLQGTPR